MSFAESSKAIFLSKISMASGPELVALDNFALELKWNRYSSFLALIFDLKNNYPSNKMSEYVSAKEFLEN